MGHSNNKTASNKPTFASAFESTKMALPKYDNDTYLKSNNPYLTNHYVSEKDVKNQLRFFPGVNATTASRYPHKYQDNEHLFYRQDELKDRRREMDAWSEYAGSSTRSLREYPVGQFGKAFDFGNRDCDPGPFRAITNQKLRYKGTIGHIGKDGEKNQGKFERLWPDS